VLEPPGLVTSTKEDPAEATRLAGTCAVNCVLLFTVVARLELLQTAVDPATKFVPVKVRLNAALPAVTLAGAMETRVGPFTWNLTPPEEKEPLRTETKFEPGACNREASTVAVSCVALVNVVGSGEPFHCTTEPLLAVAALTKFCPVTVNCKVEDPAGTEVGEIEARVGVETGADPITENVSELESVLSAF
jgi:hypothetical protein